MISFDRNYWLGSALASVVVAVVSLIDINERLANPSAPSILGRSPAVRNADVQAATLSDPAEATAEERASFHDSCRTRRKVSTNVGNGWQMFDADATEQACQCALRELAVGSSRLEWLTYIYNERGDGMTQKSVEARIEQLGRSAEDSRALVRDWRNRRQKVARSCQP